MAKRAYRLVKNYDDAAVEDEEPKEKSRPSKPAGHRVSGSTLLKLGVGVGAATLVGVLLYEIFKPKGNLSSDFNISVVILTPEVPRSGVAKIQVTVENRTTKVQNPQLRFDMWPANHEPVEGPRVNVGNIPASGDSGSTVELVMEYSLPGNWEPGTNLQAQLMLLGATAPVWNTASFGTVARETQVLVIDPVDGVVAVNPVLVQGSGVKATVNMTINNVTGSALTRTYRMDLKRHGIGTITWNEGSADMKVFSIAPGSHTYQISCIVPPNWGVTESPVAVKIMNIGDGTIYWGDLIGSDSHRIFTIIPTSELIMVSGESFVESMVPVDRRVSRAGQAISFTMRYAHIGGAANFKVAVWIKTNEGTSGGYWIGPQAFSVPQSSVSTRYTTVLSGQFKPTALPVGRVIDCLFVFTESNVVLASPPNTAQVLFGNWDSLLTVKA